MGEWSSSGFFASLRMTATAKPRKCKGDGKEATAKATTDFSTAMLTIRL
jgi:hypothetical protein